MKITESNLKKIGFQNKENSLYYEKNTLTKKLNDHGLALKYYRKTKEFWLICVYRFADPKFTTIEELKQFIKHLS